MADAWDVADAVADRIARPCLVPAGPPRCAGRVTDRLYTANLQFRVENLSVRSLDFFSLLLCVTMNLDSKNTDSAFGRLI